MKKLFALGLMVSCSACFALDGLGNMSTQSPSSVMLSKSSSRESIQSLALANFRVVTTQEAGTTIKEFVDSDGVIFAVNWDGQLAPNFKALLGSYTNSGTASGGMREMNQTDGNFVLYKLSVGRSNFGYAYLKDGLPSGFDLNSLK